MVHILVFLKYYFFCSQVDLEPQGKLHVVIELKWAPPEDGGVRPREFRERQGFNRRRGAMRRRVHQVRVPIEGFDG